MDYALDILKIINNLFNKIINKITNLYLKNENGILYINTNIKLYKL